MLRGSERFRTLRGTGSMPELTELTTIHMGQSFSEHCRWFHHGRAVIELIHKGKSFLSISKSTLIRFASFIVFYLSISVNHLYSVTEYMKFLAQ